MNIIIFRTKKHYLHIGGKPFIRKVTTLDWKRAMQTFEALFEFQTEEARKLLDTPVITELDKEVSKAYAAAPDAAARWRSSEGSRWQMSNDMSLPTARESESDVRNTVSRSNIRE